VGFVRPHVPFVAPKQYFDMNTRQQQKVISGYYASVSFMDAQVGKVMQALDQSGQAKNTIVIFTSDHGFHLGEHDLWMKVSVHKESARVPLIIRVPSKEEAICHSLVELLDLYPTTASLSGLEIPKNLQGKDLSVLFDDAKAKVREAAICGVLMRTERWAHMQYGKGKCELYDMDKDPQQYTNLISNPEYAEVLNSLQDQHKKRLAEIMNCDLVNDPNLTRGKLKNIKQRQIISSLIFIGYK